MSTDTSNIKVVARIRPLNLRELKAGETETVFVLDENTLVFDPKPRKGNLGIKPKKPHKNLMLEFDHIFDKYSTTDQMLSECTSGLVDQVMKGYNCSIFAYGATGTGKTYTMFGNDTNEGLILMTMRNLFDKIETEKERLSFTVGAVFLEVYNEQVLNLLNKKKAVKILENHKGVLITGLLPKTVTSMQDLVYILTKGIANRTQHPTEANIESSRSHAIFQAHVAIKNLMNNQSYVSKFSMVDLAGSEKSSVTSNPSINKSLLALANCLNKLCDHDKYIPYRDSNLTRLLKGSLGGNCQTLMIANISPSMTAYEDAYHTLMYAVRARNISVRLNSFKPKVGKNKSVVTKRMRELLDNNKELQRLNEELAQKVYALQKADKESIVTSHLKSWYKKIDDVYCDVIETQANITRLQSQIKSLNFRTKLKMNMETYKKNLPIKNAALGKNLQTSTASFIKIKKEIEEHNKELISWFEKQEVVDLVLNELREEIQHSKYADILKIYLMSKDLELQNIRKNISISHISNINKELLEDSAILRFEYSKACEILQDFYEDVNSKSPSLSSKGRSSKGSNESKSRSARTPYDSTTSNYDSLDDVATVHFMNSSENTIEEEKPSTSSAVKPSNSNF